MRLPFVATLFLVLICSVDSQEWIRCGAHEQYEEHMRINPEFRKNQMQLGQYTQDYSSSKAFDNNIYYIPTVFHVLHNGDNIGSDENLSPELILAQLDQLNLDFGLDNSNFDDAPLSFRIRAGDTRIQFCLATETSQGAPTSGIVRTNISSLGVNQNSCWTTSYINTRIKPSLIWDRDVYLNVFILSKIDQQEGGCVSNVLGYAQFPGGPANTDGIVIIASSVGSIEVPNPEGDVFDQGRTATHEVGHWLNLFHIWGDDTDPGEDSCAGSDEVYDTPNQLDQSSGCPDFPAYDTCTGQSGLGRMFANFMDYTNDECMYLFTNGQGSRMRAAIKGSRNSLITSECCASHPENTWVGPFSGDWYSSGTNWSLGRTPRPCDKVNIISGYSVTLNNNEIGYGYEVETGSGAQLILNTGAELCLGEIQY